MRLIFLSMSKVAWASRSPTTPEPAVNSGVGGTETAEGSSEQPSEGSSSSKNGSRDIGGMPCEYRVALATGQILGPQLGHSTLLARMALVAAWLGQWCEARHPAITEASPGGDRSEEHTSELQSLTTL